MPRPFPILVVGAVGAALFLFAGAVGFQVLTADALPLHMLTALAATLAWAFSQTWVALYGTGSARVAIAAGAEPIDARRWRRECLIWPLATTALVVGAFASGAPAFTRALPTGLHLGLALTAAVAQWVALGREAAVLRRQRAVLSTLASGPRGAS